MEYQEGDRVRHWRTNQTGIVGRNWGSDSKGNIFFVAWNDARVGFYYGWELENLEHSDNNTFHVSPAEAATADKDEQPGENMDVGAEAIREAIAYLKMQDIEPASREYQSALAAYTMGFINGRSGLVID